MTHPLTDEICNELSVHPLKELADEYADGTMTDMRAAYDFAVEKITEQWENALQSDLEHGVRSLNERYTKEFFSKYPRISSFDKVWEAMCPTADGAPWLDIAYDGGAIKRNHLNF